MDNKPCLTVLHLASGDLWAGGEVQLFTLVRTLHTTTDVYISVTLLNHGILEQKLLDLGIEVCVLDESRLNSFSILRQLIRRIRKVRPNIIHTHRSKENVLGSIAAFLSGGIPSLRTTHGNPRHDSYLEKIPQRMISYLDSMCGRYLQQRIVSVSEDLAELLGKHLPVEKVCVIENGIDYVSVQSHVKIKHPVTNNGVAPFRIGFAGRLVAIKRADLFIRTAHYIRSHFPGFKTSFHIFGDGPLLHELEMLSRELGTGDIVHFEGHCSDICEELLNIDVLAMTSDHEGLPMILLEAMALQVPVVAHAVGGIPVLLGQGSCGVLVEDQDPSSYARAIHRIALDPETQTEITRNALEQVKNNYSAEKNAQAYYELYLAIRNQVLNTNNL